MLQELPLEPILQPSTNILNLIPWLSWTFSFSSISNSDLYLLMPDSLLKMFFTSSQLLRRLFALMWTSGPLISGPFPGHLTSPVLATMDHRVRHFSNTLTSLLQSCLMALHLLMPHPPPNGARPTGCFHCFPGLHGNTSKNHWIVPPGLWSPTSSEFFQDEGDVWFTIVSTEASPWPGI